MSERLDNTVLARIIVLGISIVVVAAIIIAAVWFKPENTITPTISTKYCNLFQIINASFISVVSDDKMNITLGFDVRNLYSSPIILVAVKVPGINVTKELNKLIDPGQIFTYSFKVYSGEYLPSWKPGTEHTVVFIYKIQGQTINQSVYVKALVI
jgi:hypothetical protein